jgi:hypothetical protein
MDFLIRVSLRALKPAELDSRSVVFVPEVTMGKGDPVVDHSYNRGWHASIVPPPKATLRDCVMREFRVQRLLGNGRVQSIAKFR